MAGHNEWAHYIRMVMMKYTSEFPDWADNFIYEMASDLTQCRLTPVPGDGAEVEAGDVEGETRPAPEHNG